MWQRNITNCTRHLKSNSRDTVLDVRCDIKLVWDVTWLLSSQHLHLIKVWWYLWKTSHLPPFSKQICALLGGSPSHFPVDAPNKWEIFRLAQEVPSLQQVGVGVGHASKPNPIPLAAGMSLQSYRFGGWSYSPAQLFRHLLTGRAGGQGQPQPTFTVCDRGVHWSLSDRASPDTSQALCLRALSEPNQLLQPGGHSARVF